MAGYSVTYTVVDQATAQINAINKRIAALRAPLDAQARAMQRFMNVSGLKSVAEGFKTIASAATSAATSIGKIVPAVGALTAATTVAGIGKLVTDFGNLATELTKTGMLLDETPERLSGVAQAMRSLGGDANTALAALKEVRDTMYDAAIGLNQQAGYQFAQWGIKLVDAQNNLRDVIDVEVEMMQKLDAMPNSMDRQRAALRAGGQAFLDTYLQLKATNTSYDEYIRRTRQMQTLDAERTRSLRDFSLAMGGLNAAFYDLGATVAGAVAPALTPLFQELSKYITQHKGEIEQDVRGMAKAFQDWVESGGAAKAVDNLGKIGTALAKIIEAGEWFVAHPALAGALLGAYAGGRVGGVYGAIGGAAVGAVAGHELGQPAADSAYDEYLKKSNMSGDVLSREQFVQQYNSGLRPLPAGPKGTPQQYGPPAAATPTPAPTPAPAATPTPAPGPQGAATPAPATGGAGMIFPAGWQPDANAPHMETTQQTISHPERNNPGNLRVGPNDWVGKTTQPGAAFESFQTMDQGIRARALTYNSYLKRGVNTIASIANTSGPASDNNDIPSQIAAYRNALGGKYLEKGGENLPIEATPENIRRLTMGGISIEAGGGGKWLPKGAGESDINRVFGSMASGASAPVGGAAPAGGGKVTSTAALAGVNPILSQAVLAGMNEILPPGYTAKATSGREGRNDPRSQHSRGRAEDWQIFDPNGREVPNRGNASGLYRQAYVHSMAWMMQNHPELVSQFRWGGHFGTALGGGGEADDMHFDLGALEHGRGRMIWKGHDASDPGGELAEARALLAARGAPQTLVAGGGAPNGSVNIDITHKNAPATVQVSASSFGTGLNLGAPRVEHQQFGEL